MRHRTAFVRVLPSRAVSPRPAGGGLAPLVYGLYEPLFDRPWSVMTSGLVFGTLNVFLFALDRPWTASDGMRNWGDWARLHLGLGGRGELVSPLVYLGSLLNLGVLGGAFAAALLSRQFAIRIAPHGELLKGAVGGALMGIGSVAAFGCNIGGFFSALSALSLSGLAMMVGLCLGAYAGLHYLRWEVKHWPGLSEGPGRRLCAASRPGLGWQPLLGLAALVLLAGAAALYDRSGYTPHAVFLLLGVTFGVVSQRSRLCFVRAFREPFMAGDGEHTRAAALGLVVSLVGFTILKFTNAKDPGDWVFPAFGMGALGGGILFGVGMVLAGGCGVGSLWRAGEGHVKLWLTVGAFALFASLGRPLLARPQIAERLGVAVFLPARVGWGGSVLLVAAVMAAWYVFATWSMRSRRFEP